MIAHCTITVRLSPAWHPWEAQDCATLMATNTASALTQVATTAHDLLECSYLHSTPTVTIACPTAAQTLLHLLAFYAHLVIIQLVA
jgi:hypothetical protein